jgi:RNA polymerase sigma-70 factor (ECF subfamily)
MMRTDRDEQEPGLNDHHLIQRVQQGDPAAERALYDAHVERIFRLAYRMTGDEALAEDLTQETFVRAFDRLDHFRGESALATWLYSVGMRTVLSGLRKVRRLRDHERAAEVLPEQPAPSRRDAELRLLLDEAIDALPEDMRLVFLMHDVEGFKHREIAAGLEITTGTSKSRLHRARAWLRDYLARVGYELAEEDVS